MLTALIVKLAQWLINSVFIIWHKNLMELKIDVILQYVVLYCSYGRYEYLSPYFHFQTCCIILSNESLSNPRESQIRINWKTSQSRQRIKKTPSINTEDLIASIRLLEAWVRVFLNAARSRRWLTGPRRKRNSAKGMFIYSSINYPPAITLLYN